MAEKEGEETEIYKNFTGRNYTCAQTCSLRVWAKSCEEEHGELLNQT